MQVWLDKFDNQMSTLRPAHEQRCACMILERLLEAKQNPTCVDDPPKNPSPRNKTKLQCSQKGGTNWGNWASLSCNVI